MIRFFLNEGEFQGIAAVEIDGRRYTPEEIEQVVRNAARPMCAPRTHFPGEGRARAEGAATWICAAYGCDRIRNGNNPYCKMHQQRVVRHGSAETVLKVGRKKR